VTVDTGQLEVWVDQDLCTGDGLCVQYAPEVFEFDIDGLAYVKDGGGDLQQAPGSRVSWASDIMYFSGQHGAPTIDAIGHIGRDLKLHGGVDAVAATATPGGITNNLGIESFPADLMVNRAVLLDVARHLNGGRPDPLAPDVEITADHLEQTMKAQGVEVRPGDSLLIRTGWGRYFGTDNARYLGEKSPGPGQDAAGWIIAKKVRLAGDDTATCERRPAAYGKELFSVHMMLLADNGIYIVENANLEPLAIQADRTMRYDLLSRVMQTARLAGFRNLTLQVNRVADAPTRRS